MPDPYIKKEPNDLIRAADWNAIQVRARTDLQSHDHAGGENGTPIATSGLADGAVSTTKLAALAVTGDRIADTAISEDKLATGAVTRDKLATDAVTADKLANGSVSGDKLAAGAVTNGQLANGAVTNDKIADGTITQAKLDPNIQLNQNLRLLTPAGGDGQIGIPGETLEIALRVRVSSGNQPIAGAQVEFALLDLAYNGQPLDQYTGGCVHASSNVVSMESWPNGTRARRAIVRTEADGTAQVQRVLGTQPGLTVQRVEATLLDEQGNRTSQKTLFTAHLSLATEVAWFRNPLLSALEPPPGTTVQSVLDSLAAALDQMGLWQLGTRPFVLTDSGGVPLESTLQVRCAQWRGIVLIGVPLQGAQQEQIQNALAVYVDARSKISDGTLESDALLNPTRLVGDVQPSGSSLRWNPGLAAQNWLGSNEYYKKRVIVELIPSALGLRGPPLRWCFCLIP